MDILGNFATPNIFIPSLNVIQERSLNQRITLNIDFQNNNLYILQEITRCAALLNFINHNGRDDTHQHERAKLNGVFDTFMRINDPIGILINNFEQFFGMYIHSKYGSNNFKLYMKECEKSPVAYPINVFENGMCIFMQYNKSELRSYIYSIITMFYYYTGQSFYDMIYSPNIIPRPSDIDEYSSTRDIRRASSTASKNKSTEDKLCALNRQNRNINQPFIRRRGTTQLDGLVTTQHFQKCIPTNRFPNEHHYNEVILGKSSRPVVISNIMQVQKNVNVVANVTCKRSGISDDANIFQLSTHLKRSINGERDTISDNIDMSYEQRPQCNNKTFVQTNFAKVWCCDNRRHLVSLAIMYSVMNVCIQKITYSLLDDTKKTNQLNDDTIDCNRLFSCIPHPTKTVVGENISVKESRKQTIKPKKCTIEVSFNRETAKRVNNCLPNKLNFSV